jgi:hypothetical protein
VGPEVHPGPERRLVDLGVAGDELAALGQVGDAARDVDWSRAERVTTSTVRGFAKLPITL